MSDPKQERDSDRDSLTGWTLVDREGTPEDTSQEDTTSPPEGDGAEGDGGEVEEAEEESGYGMEEECEEEEEPLSDDLVTMGQRVQEIKGESIKAPSSGSESSDIETLECPGQEEYSEDDVEDDHPYPRGPYRASYLSSAPHTGFTFVDRPEDGDIESMASTDVSLLGEGNDKKQQDEDTDLSLASSPSLPDDLPAIRPDVQYKHTPDKDLNTRLNVVMALTVACVLGLGIGHFLGWSSRTKWQENLNSAQVIEALAAENRDMENEITRLQQEMIAPIKIGGKDGKQARELRERINHLILDNEELRMALGKLQFASVPDGDKDAFNTVLKNNYNLRIAVNKLRYLGPNLSELKVSANDLQAENQELQIEIGKLRYQQQPLPQELNAVAREIENMKKAVKEASKKKKAPPGLDDAKTYVNYMSQILSAIQTLHAFGTGSFFEKVDVATDVFETLVPGNVKLSPTTQQKLTVMQQKFSEIRLALSRSWEEVKELSHPQKIVGVGRDTLSKMNRVIVNVVNKMKEIGQTNILNRGKASIDKTITTMADRFSALDAQFDKTWNALEAEAAVEEEEGNEEMSVAGEIEAEEDPSPVSVVVSLEPEEVEEEVASEVASEDSGIESAAEEGEESLQEESLEEAQQSSTKPGKGGKKGGDGGDKKKKPEDKKNKKADKKDKAKKEEKKKEKQEAKQQKSRRNRIRSSEEKKEKKEAQKKEKESKKDEKETARQEKVKKNERVEESSKHGRGRDSKSGSRKHGGDRDAKEESKRYFKGQYNKYDKKRHYDDDDDDDDDYRHSNKRKYQKTAGQYYDDDDDDDDDDDEDNKYRMKKYNKHHDDDNDDDDDDDRHLRRRQGRHSDYDEDGGKKKGLTRHWQKPSKKSHHREDAGPKKAFIRRRDD